jgi:hypothetical protein
MPTRKRSAPGRRRVTPQESRHPLKLPRGRSEAEAIKRLRAICLALPEVTEKIAWGEPTWRAGKIFAQMDTHHHGADHIAVWLPARPGVQEALIEEYPEHCFRPPYVGHKGWIGVRIDRDPDWNVVAGLVREAYREVASPRLVTRMEADQDTSRGRWGRS